MYCCKKKPEALHSLGPALRQRREKLGFSISDLAKYVKVTPEYITQIELGQKLPNPDVFLSILDYLKPASVGELEDIFYHYLRAKYPKLARIVEFLNNRAARDAEIAYDFYQAPWDINTDERGGSKDNRRV